MFRPIPLLASLLLYLGFGHALAASLRAVVELTGPEVRLSDLFAGLPQDADRVLGPSPAPGERIVVGAAQLAAIARQFHVDWQPSTRTERVVLERPGRALPREVVLDALKAALADAGCSAHCQIDVATFPRPMIALEAKPNPVVEQFDYDTSSGNFVAVISVARDNDTPLRLRLSGRASPTATLPVLVRRILPGAVIDATDVKLSEVRTNLINGEVAQSLDQLIGHVVKRMIAANQPVALADLGAQQLVQRGAPVLMTLDVGGLSVRVEGEALQEGALGEHIKVRNPLSLAVIDAVVTGPNTARVAPGSLPLVPPQSGQGGYPLMPAAYR
jgi:flagella basal body P-ring formation protein FlgA